MSLISIISKQHGAYLTSLLSSGQVALVAHWHWHALGLYVCFEVQSVLLIMHWHLQLASSGNVIDIWFILAKRDVKEDNVFDMIIAGYYDKPLILIGATIGRY